MNGHLLMHIYDIAGGRNIGVNNASNAINDINAKQKSKRKNLRDNINLNFYRWYISPENLHKNGS